MVMVVHWPDLLSGSSAVRGSAVGWGWWWYSSLICSVVVVQLGVMQLDGGGGGTVA